MWKIFSERQACFPAEIHMSLFPFNFKHGIHEFCGHVLNGFWGVTTGFHNFSEKEKTLRQQAKGFASMLYSEVVHLSGQFQDCHISEESLKLEGSSRNDRSLRYGELWT